MKCVSCGVLSQRITLHTSPNLEPPILFERTIQVLQESRTQRTNLKEKTVRGLFDDFDSKKTTTKKRGGYRSVTNSKETALETPPRDTLKEF